MKIKGTQIKVAKTAAIYFENQSYDKTAFTTMYKLSTINK